MPIVSRRDMLLGSAAVVLAPCMSATRAFASPFGLPVGLQLYSVRDLLPKDYEGVLRKVASLGYQEAEAAGFFDHTAAQVKQAMSAAGLRCVSGHYPWDKLGPGLDQIIAFHQEIGAEYIICASPGHKTPPAPGTHAPITLDDWRWNADRFNEAGRKVKAAGLRFGYHNHTAEVQPINGTVPLEEMLRLTDPGLVTFEMDCGWVVVGGGDPVTLLQRYPGRFTMFHVKDFKPSDQHSNEHAPPGAELGHGHIDYRTIFRAAKRENVKHIFVEQENFDMDPYAALKIDADYVHNLTV